MLLSFLFQLRYHFHIRKIVFVRHYHNGNEQIQSFEYGNDTVIGKEKIETNTNENEELIQSRNILFPSSSRRESHNVENRIRNKVDFENKNGSENLDGNRKEEKGEGDRDKDIYKINNMGKNEVEKDCNDSYYYETQKLNHNENLKNNRDEEGNKMFLD